MKTINIYLTKQEQKQAKEIQLKYKVSLSTLVDKVCYATYHAIKHYPIKETEKLTNEYIGQGSKTSVKPRCLLDQKEYLYQVFANERNKNIFATNSLKIFLSKSYKQYFDEKGLQEYYQKIDKELTKADDKNWNYNDQLRSMVRLVKNNKEYFKKFIEE